MASTHLKSLSDRHARLEGQIAAEMLRPMPDDMKIAQLKRQKLQLKEKVAALSSPG